MCPYGAAELGSLVVGDLTPVLGLPPMAPDWEFGSWVHDPNFNDPAGACPDDQPPPRYAGASPCRDRPHRPIASARGPPPTAVVMRPIGFVTGGRTDTVDDHWGPVEATIELDSNVVGPDATAGLADFSHVEVVFIFDRVADDEITRGCAPSSGTRQLARGGHPRPTSQEPSQPDRRDPV